MQTDVVFPLLTGGGTHAVDRSAREAAVARRNILDGVLPDCVADLRIAVARRVRLHDQRREHNRPAERIDKYLIKVSGIGLLSELERAVCTGQTDIRIAGEQAIRRVSSHLPRVRSEKTFEREEHRIAAANVLAAAHAPERCRHPAAA